MTVLAHHPPPGRLGRPLRLERARLAAVPVAVTLHILLLAGLAGVWRTSPPEALPAPQIVRLNLVSPPAEPEPAPVPVPVPEAVPEPAQPEAEPVRARPEPVPAATARTADIAGPADILTAEGGQAGFAPDAPRQGAAARSLACAVASGQMREAIGCDGARDGAFEGFTAHADAETVARIDRAFAITDDDPGARTPTANLAPLTLPGQTFSQHSHYVSGAHSAFGRLSLPERARDPGFGD